MRGRCQDDHALEYHRERFAIEGHYNEITFQRVYAHVLDPEATPDAVADKINDNASRPRAA